MGTKTAVITGGSRGIGATTAIYFAERGYNVVITYRNKAARADEVVKRIEAAGGKCTAVQADLTIGHDRMALIQEILAGADIVDALILNAAGGLEKDAAVDHAHALNVEANRVLVEELSPRMPAGSTVVFVTSHMAHFHGRKPVVSGYERVASTKRVAEDMLLAKIPDLAALGIKLIVITGDLIDGTVNAKLMNREYPALIQARISDVGPLPTVEEFSKAIVDATQDEAIESGHVVFVGSTDWNTYDRVYHDEQMKINSDSAGSVSQ